MHDTLDALNRGLVTAVAMVEENRQPIKDAVGRVREHVGDPGKADPPTRIAHGAGPPSGRGVAREGARGHGTTSARRSKDVNVITETGRETVTLNKDQINGMLVNLKETSDHLKAASKEIRRNPWRLFYQPTVEEAAQANVFDAAREFSEAATHLDDSLTRLQALSQA